MNQTSSRRILLLAPHQDDECLQTAGIIYQAAHSGSCKRVLRYKR